MVAVNWTGSSVRVGMSPRSRASSTHWGSQRFESPWDKWTSHERSLELRLSSLNVLTPPPTPWPWTHQLWCHLLCLYQLHLAHIFIAVRVTAPPPLRPLRGFDSALLFRNHHTWTGTRHRGSTTADPWHSNSCFHRSTSTFFTVFHCTTSTFMAVHILSMQYMYFQCSMSSIAVHVLSLRCMCCHRSTFTSHRSTCTFIAVYVQSLQYMYIHYSTCTSHHN